MTETWQQVAASIRARDKDHVELLAAVLKADDGALFLNDLLVSGVTQRSMEITKGFLAMLRSGNYLCGGALLRMQLDNILRLYAATLFPAGGKAVEAMLKGIPLARVKSPDGKPLTDHELTVRVSKLYPWLPNVYKATSGFIHFSTPGILSPFTGFSKDGRVTVQVGYRRGRTWKPSERLEAALAFREATSAILELIYAWGHTKHRVGKSRTKDSDTNVG